MLMDAQEHDVGTARLRSLIANLHNRNRVLERQTDLSVAALKWIAAPLEEAAVAALKAAGGDDPLGKMDTNISIVEVGDSNSYNSTSLITNPLVIGVIDEYRENEKNHTFKKLKEPVFSPRLPDCTQDYLEQHRRAGSLNKVNHACMTPLMKKKQIDLHGPKHLDVFPDYIHFVHIPSESFSIKECLSLGTPAHLLVHQLPGCLAACLS